MTRAQFDREQVIRDATQLFWQQGFSGASMQQVVKATGLKPGSLYLAFGSKEGLYQAALESYTSQLRAAVCRVLDDAPSVGEGVCQLVLQLVEECGSGNYCSCFLIKSQLELAASGSDLLHCISGYLSQMEDLYADYLSREHSPEQARLYAASLMLHVLGLRVYGYLGRSRETTIAAAKAGLPWLPWHKVDVPD